ncbi:MAG TPA: hypothetical protein VN688_31475 [Gemmataceae bacterium]|nr:hypothetical protein [Gemmataceae bacterium]
MNRKTIFLALALALSPLCLSRAQADDTGRYADAQQDVNRIVNNSLGSINDSYRGTHQYFNDDVISRLFSKISTTLMEEVLKPFWKGLMERNPLCVVLAVIIAGFLLRFGAKLFESLN